MPAGNYTFDVKDFAGVVGDGQHDDMAGIQMALDAAGNRGGGSVFFPPGWYKASTLRPGNNTILYGAGESASILYAADATSDLVAVTVPFVSLHDLGFNASVPRTAGAYVAFGPTSGACTLSHFSMAGGYIGVRMQGTDRLYVEHGGIRDTSTLDGGCGILVDGGNDHYLRCITMNNEPDQQPTAGIYIKNTGCTNITDCDIIGSGNCLLITGGYSIYAINSFFDSAKCGIRLLAQNNIQRCRFLGCWTSSHQEHGFLIEPQGTGLVDTIEILGHQAFFNGFDGIHLGNGSNLKVEGSSCCQNANGCGVQTGQGIRNLILFGNHLGASTAMRGNKIGIWLNGGDYMQVLGNNMAGNTQVSLLGRCPHQIVANNFY